MGPLVSLFFPFPLLFSSLDIFFPDYSPPSRLSTHDLASPPFPLEDVTISPLNPPSALQVELGLAAASCHHEAPPHCAEPPLPRATALLHEAAASLLQGTATLSHRTAPPSCRRLEPSRHSSKLPSLQATASLLSAEMLTTTVAVDLGGGV